MKTFPAGKYYVGDPCYAIADWSGFISDFIDDMHLKNEVTSSYRGNEVWMGFYSLW